MSEPRYDTIGRTYTATRRPDFRIGARILHALGDARAVVNVGAGAGAYEPWDRLVIAVEPSRTMIRQRPPGAAIALQASAEAIPLGDASVEAALAILTVHHWSDRERAFAEIRRVASRRAAFLTWGPGSPTGGSESWLHCTATRQFGSLSSRRCPSLRDARVGCRGSACQAAAPLS